MRCEELMARDKVKRAFVWIRKSLRIIDRTTLPGEILGEIRPTLDTFGWERYDTEPQAEGITGALGSDNIQLATVPDGVLRYYMNVSTGHNDTVAITLDQCVQVVTDGQTVAIAPFASVPVLPVSSGIIRAIILRPGEFLRARSTPAPGGAFTMQITASFIDLEPGEYIAPL